MAQSCLCEGLVLLIDMSQPWDGDAENINEFGRVLSAQVTLGRLPSLLGTTFHEVRRCAETHQKQVGSEGNSKPAHLGSVEGTGALYSP